MEIHKILNIHGNISVIFFSLNNTRWCIYFQNLNSNKKYSYWFLEKENTSFFTVHAAREPIRPAAHFARRRSPAPRPQPGPGLGNSAPAWAQFGPLGRRLLPAVGAPPGRRLPRNHSFISPPPFPVQAGGTAAGALTGVASSGSRGS